jgi:hypothetical protein
MAIIATATVLITGAVKHVGHVLGTLPVFPTSTMASMLAFPSPGTPEFYGTLAAIIPALAYPFLPQPGLDSIHILTLMNEFIQCANVVFALLGRSDSFVFFPIWVALLVPLTLIVTTGRNILQAHRGANTENSFAALGYMAVLVTSGAICASIANQPVFEWAWTTCTFSNASIYLAVVFLSAAAIKYYLLDTIAHGLQRLSARHISSWTWLGIERTGTLVEVFGDAEHLPKDEKECPMEVFAPGWSVLIMYLVFPITVYLDSALCVEWCRRF